MKKISELIWGGVGIAFITSFLKDFGDILHQIKKYTMIDEE